MPPDEEPGHLGPEQALRALEERLIRASDAAERLIAEAAGAAARGIGSIPGPGPAGRKGPEDDAVSPESPGTDGSTPAAGWSQESTRTQPRAGEAEIESLVRFVRSLGELIPPELQHRVAEAVRELLLAVRALIDWYLERAEQRRAAPREMQDIPIL